MSGGKKGFITIASGDEKYYVMAHNLLKSYRQHTGTPLPFAIICDRKNSLTELFDDVIVLEDMTRSYVDKLRMGEVLPYDETIFIDADCLAYGDLNVLFEVFSHADDVSCFGKVYAPDEPDSKKGWFDYERLPESEKSAVKFVVDHHGGLIYMRNTGLTREVFRSAEHYAENYGAYPFLRLTKPADEPALALAMAVHNCRPIPFTDYRMVCFWNTKISFGKPGQLPRRPDRGWDVELIHWGSKNTDTPVYKRELARMDLLHAGAGRVKLFMNDLRWNFKIAVSRIGNR